MAEAMPEVPEFITPEMEALFGAEAQRAVRGERPHADHSPDSHDGPDRRWLDAETFDTIHTVLAGVTIAIVAATASIGLLFVWLAVPYLAYTLVAVAAFCALGWAVYFPMRRRSRRGSG